MFIALCLYKGMCYIYSDTLRQTAGKIENTITSMKHQPIGRLQGEFGVEIINVTHTSVTVKVIYVMDGSSRYLM